MGYPGHAPRTMKNSCPSCWAGSWAVSRGPDSNSRPSHAAGGVRALHGAGRARTLRSMSSSVSVSGQHAGPPRVEFTEADQRTLDRFSNYHATVGLVSILIGMSMGVFLIMALISIGYDATALEPGQMNPGDYTGIWWTVLAVAAPNAWLNLKAAAALQRRERHALCVLASLVSCVLGLNILLPPLGLVAGIWGLRVLNRPHVKDAFRTLSRSRLVADTGARA